MILIIHLQTQSAKRVSPLLIHPKDPEQIHRFTGESQPIIIISLPTSLITMYNLKRFLEISTYVSRIFLFLFSFKPPKSSFEPPQKPRARTIVEGNPKPDN